MNNSHDLILIELLRGQLGTIHFLKVDVFKAQECIILNGLLVTSWDYPMVKSTFKRLC